MPHRLILSLAIMVLFFTDSAAIGKIIEIKTGDKTLGVRDLFRV